MIVLLAALALQSIPELPVLTVPRDCPEDADNCVMAYGEWDEESGNLPREYNALDEVYNFPGGQQSLLWSGLSAVVQGRLEGGSTAVFEVRYQNSMDYLTPCGGLESRNLIWPLLGYSPEGHPVIATEQGEFEIRSGNLSMHWPAQLLIVDADTLAQQARVPLIMDSSDYLFDEDGSVYLQRRNGNCLRVPMDRASLYHSMGGEFCDALEADGGRPEAVDREDPEHPMNRGFEFPDSEFTWAELWLKVRRVPNLPGRLILDDRIACT